MEINVNSSGIVCGRTVSTDWPSRLAGVAGVPSAVAADLAYRHFLVDESSSSNNTTYYNSAQLGISLFDDLMIDGLDPQQQSDQGQLKETTPPGQSSSPSLPVLPVNHPTNSNMHSIEPVSQQPPQLHEQQQPTQQISHNVISPDGGSGMMVAAANGCALPAFNGLLRANGSANGVQQIFLNHHQASIPQQSQLLLQQHQQLTEQLAAAQHQQLTSFVNGQVYGLFNGAATTAPAMNGVSGQFKVEPATEATRCLQEHFRQQQQQIALQTQLQFQYQLQQAGQALLQNGAGGGGTANQVTSFIQIPQSYNLQFQEMATTMAMVQQQQPIMIMGTTTTEENRLPYHVLSTEGVEEGEEEYLDEEEEGTTGGEDHDDDRGLLIANGPLDTLGPPEQLLNDEGEEGHPHLGEDHLMGGGGGGCDQEEVDERNGGGMEMPMELFKVHQNMMQQRLVYQEQPSGVYSTLKMETDSGTDPHQRYAEPLGRGPSELIGGPPNGTATATPTHNNNGNQSANGGRKIRPVLKPGLVLKTPIAFQGDVDPSEIPIQKDGMAVCERCGAIGVKHSFYTKYKIFCSLNCARNFEEEQFKRSQSQESPRNSKGAAAPKSSRSTVVGGGGISLQSGRVGFKRKQRNMDYVSYGGSGRSDEDNSVNSTEFLLRSNQYNLYGSDRECSTDVLYRDLLPQEDLPELVDMPLMCPEEDRIETVNRRKVPVEVQNSYDWTGELVKSAGLLAAPVSCFRHAPGHDFWSKVMVNMKVEVENTDCDSNNHVLLGHVPHSFWVATILQIQGYKALLRYEGFDDASHDFWANLCSSEVHNVGWCATRGKPLIPPKSIEHKFSDWKRFLIERLFNSRTLSSSFYNRLNVSMKSRFRVGLQLEIVDKEKISQVRLATVESIVGKRLHVRYNDNGDGFCCHEDSALIHHVGWAAMVGHKISAPIEYLTRMARATQGGSIDYAENDAAIELFRLNFVYDDYYLGRPSRFKQGMKLEAIDPLNPSSICVASVMSVLKFGYLMIRIDVYEPLVFGDDWFCYHERSPYIFPVGFCGKHGLELTAPKGYDAATFDWDSYLDDSGSVAAMDDLFERDVPRHEFQVGMKIECADLMDPKLVCVATVSRIVGRLLRINFDGWDDVYDQWLDIESPDMYPLGWCFLVKHRLEGPKVATKPLQKVAGGAAKMGRGRKVKTKKIKSEGSVVGKNGNDPATAKKTKAPPAKVKQGLPVSNAAVLELDDSASLPNVEQEEIMVGGGGELISDDGEPQAIEEEPTPESGKISPLFNSSGSLDHEMDHLESLDSSSAVAEMRSLHPGTWTVKDVVKFLRENDCASHCESMEKRNVNGEQLLKMSKDDIIMVLGMKVGPALKIFELIQQLKDHIDSPIPYGRKLSE